MVSDCSFSATRILATTPIQGTYLEILPKFTLNAWFGLWSTVDLPFTTCPDSVRTFAQAWPARRNTPELSQFYISEVTAAAKW